jgi:hypothetical protein
MKKLTSTTVMGVGIAAVLASAALLAAPQRRGTDILHFFVRTAMTNEGVETNATGRVEANQNRQGRANNQLLKISVNGLTTNTTYQLLALVNDDVSLTPIAEFDTDGGGRASVNYRTNATGKGKLGRGQTVLPAELDPVSQIREVVVANGGAQAVLRADLTSPDKLQYLVKRSLGTNGVNALLSIQANTTRTRFRLTASGLEPSSDYLLVLNGGVVQTNTSTAKGKLVIDSLLEDPGDILDVRSLALWDSANNVILSTDLP